MRPDIFAPSILFCCLALTVSGEIPEAAPATAQPPRYTLYAPPGPSETYPLYPAPSEEELQNAGPAQQEQAEAEPEAEEEAEEPLDPTVRPLQYLKESMLWCYSEDCFWRKVEIEGYLDQTVTYNFNDPDDRVNTLRVFDRKHRAYLLNTFQLYVHKDSEEESPLGFALRLNTGWDADVISPYGVAADDKFDVTEAYLSWYFNTCVGRGVTVKAGKFVTLAGAEVIEQKDNFNISRSFLFGYAIPFTHTGVRAAWELDDIYTLTFGVNRGWDTFTHDNNDALTYEAAITANCSDRLSLSAVTYYGAEQEDNDHSKRRLLDLVATYKFNEKLTGVLNADIASEEDAAPDGSTAKWRGIAGYLNYECNEKLSYAARAEVFSDRDGARTGMDQTLWEATLTAQYKFRENIWGRLEFRHDESNRSSAFSKGSGFSGSQNTIAASMLITF